VGTVFGKDHAPKNYKHGRYTVEARQTRQRATDQLREGQSSHQATASALRPECRGFAAHVNVLWRLRERAMERLMSDKAALSDVRRWLRQRCGLEADYQPQELGDRLGDFLLAGGLLHPIPDRNFSGLILSISPRLRFCAGCLYAAKWPTYSTRPSENASGGPSPGRCSIQRSLGGEIAVATLDLGSGPIKSGINCQGPSLSE
jgi:hypothetical protein